ncbi:PPE domain-containing protein [Actinoalloteichus hymeniacidonis]|uniref:PPE-repeat containing protein n=1 Tax=Actinoalloteichus hymeniacidonis TaxID=340345 RepID=A0AAC9MXC0_9PSEU|nr:PPE domain-containing protein [Actinoalloteichus hymeniacidonis]AOS61742.1 PPE-repeat containing protein [Actinoalloteichus hymeniacidonis]MBB5910240.1 hypothetical protein [Actinoalloteichus hymeniacidonis]
MHVEGSGDEIRYTRYEGFSLQEKYDWMQAGRGPDAAEQVREALGELAGSMAESDVVLRGALKPLGMEWEGAAASALGAAGAQAAAWSLGSSDAAQAASMGMTASGASFALARNSVEPPAAVSGPSTGELFGQVFTGPFGGLDDTVAEFEAEAAKGHDADRALYAYESMLREANSGMGPIPAPPQIVTQDARHDPAAPGQDRTGPVGPPPPEVVGPPSPGPAEPTDPPGSRAPIPPTEPGPVPEPPPLEAVPPPWGGERPPLQPEPPFLPEPPVFPGPPPADPGPPGRIDRPDPPSLTPSWNHQPTPVTPAPPSTGPAPIGGGHGGSGFGPFGSGGVPAPGGGFGSVGGPGAAPGVPGGPGRFPAGTGGPTGLGPGSAAAGAAGRPGMAGGLGAGGLGAPGGGRSDSPEDVEHSNRYAAPSDEFFGLDDLPSVAPAVFGDEPPRRDR